MQRASADMAPPTVVRRFRNNGTGLIGLTVDQIRYWLQPYEALSLADRLVDAAESVEKGDVNANR